MSKKSIGSNHLHPLPGGDEFAKGIECAKHVIEALRDPSIFTVADWNHHAWTLWGHATRYTLGEGNDPVIIGKMQASYAAMSDRGLADELEGATKVNFGDDPKGFPWVTVLAIALEILRRFIK